MATTTLLVISDSHAASQPMERVLASVPHDVAVHLGDHMTSKEFMDDNFDYWVAGNNDVLGPPALLFKVDGVTFLALHGDAEARFTFKAWVDALAKEGLRQKADVVLFGHSHFASLSERGKVTVANPGSIAMPRFWHAGDGVDVDPAKPSYLVVTVTDGRPSFSFRNAPAPK